MSHDMKAIAGAAPSARTPAHGSDQPYTSSLDVEDVAGPETRRRAPRISGDEVFATADALLLEGIRPSIERIRMRLGRGSPNTINDHLDVWWRKLGSRLRDLPGGEFPQLPESVGERLVQLWNEALSAAHESLQATLSRRNELLDLRERQLAARELSAEREAQASTARAAAMEDALQLMRRQLEEANQRARTIEEALETRNGDLTALRGELERVQQECTELLAQQERERGAASAERARLEDRHEAMEEHWLAEVDRAPQVAKMAESHVRDLQGRLDDARKEREALRSDAQLLRGKLATAQAVREQLEARLKMQAGAPARKKPRTASSASAKSRIYSNRPGRSRRP